MSGLFKVNKKAAGTVRSGGGKYISTSGIYPIKIKFASLDVSSGGANSVNFNVDYEGNPSTLYGPYVTNKKGDPLEIGLEVLNNLLVIAGLEDGQEPVVEEETHKVGRDNKEQEFAVITDLSDLDVMVRVQEEYSEWQGEIKKRITIRGFYSEDGASADEIVNETEVGVQLKKDEAYASNVTYRDELTPEAVEAWKAEKSGKGGDTKAATTPKASTKPKSSLFK